MKSANPAAGPGRTAMKDARRIAALPDSFPMARGGVLHGGQVAYETWGNLNSARDNAILLFTGLSPSAHAASSPEDPSDGWWEGMIGPGLAIDTERYFVICVNSLGSCYGSSGPASIDPATSEVYRLGFPDLSLEDIARAGFETARSLGIERLDAVMGPSLGGMVVLAYAAQFPGAARRLISISGTTAASPFAIALRSIQREAILRDPQWQSGNYPLDAQPREGMRLARMLGMLTYRSAAEWRERFARERIRSDKPSTHPFAPEFTIQSYLEAHAERFARVFDANCYLYLSRAMDRFDLGDHGESHAAALRPSGLERALVIGVETDMLFPPPEQRAVASALQSAGIPADFALLPCIEGHDSFLIDLEAFGAEIRRFLNV